MGTLLWRDTTQQRRMAPPPPRASSLLSPSSILRRFPWRKRPVAPFPQLRVARSGSPRPPRTLWDILGSGTVDMQPLLSPSPSPPPPRPRSPTPPTPLSRIPQRPSLLRRTPWGTLGLRTVDTQHLLRPSPSPSPRSSLRLERWSRLASARGRPRLLHLLVQSMTLWTKSSRKATTTTTTSTTTMPQPRRRPRPSGSS